MKKITVLLLLLLSINYSYSVELTADIFAFDEEQIYDEFAELTQLESAISENVNLSATDINRMCSNFYNFENIKIGKDLQLINSLQSSGNMSYFWTGFAVGAVGAFFLYSAVAGPITVAIIYFVTDKDIEKTKKAAWGCAAGTALGFGIKFLLSSR